MSKSFSFFQMSEPERALEDLRNKPAVFWEKKGREMALALFRYTYGNVTAYKRLLASKKIKSSSIKSIEDFNKLPILDKTYYLRRSKTVNLFPNKDLSQVTTFSATSGSTGEPFYFPRGEAQDAQYRYIAEMFMRNQWEIDSHRTLGVIGFGLGIWIGGIFTYKNLNRIAADGIPLSLVPVGANIDIYLRSIKTFGHLFEQIILMGYAPFIKDIIDEGADYGINWKRYKIRILTAAEGWSEKLRNYISEKTGLENPLIDTVNIYGTVELGTMAHETAFSNLIRKIAVENKEVFKALFPQANRLPTLTQYYPHLIYFEEVGGEVLATGFGSSFPLLRYRFPDMGGVISFETMISKLQQAGVDIMHEARQAKIMSMITRLPFVYVYDRADHTVILRGANVYAEEVKNALHENGLHQMITGKFSMMVKENRKVSEYLEIHIELKKNIRESEALKKRITQTLVDELIKTNSEFKDQYTSAPHRTTPKVVLWPYQHPHHFKLGGKQKWVKK